MADEIKVEVAEFKLTRHEAKMLSKIIAWDMVEQWIESEYPVLKEVAELALSILDYGDGK